MNIRLANCFLALIFCLSIFSHEISYADLSLDLIQVTHDKHLECFIFEPVWLHTTLHPAEKKINKNGFYNSHAAASGACILGDKQLTWEYKPFSSSNPTGYCGASNFGGALTVKINDKLFLKDIHIGGDPSYYGSPINKIIVNTYNEDVEAFVYTRTTDNLYSAYVNYDDKNPITSEYIHNKIIPESIVVDDEFESTLKSAEQGDADAQNNLGLMYYNGDGVTQNYKQAVGWFAKATKQGHAGAQNNLGVMYEKGQGIKQNYEQAVRWYINAAEQEYAEAQNNLGYMYKSGLGVTQDYEQTVKWFTKSAKQKNANAQYNLGVMFYNGIGVTQDYNQAIKWFTKAIDQKHAEAQNNLGLMYCKGEGVIQDYKQALKLYTKSAKQGYAVAQNNLGVMYYKGYGVTKDYKQAYAWINLSSSQGYGRSKKAKNFLLKKMSSEQIAQAKKISKQLYAEIYGHNL